MRTFFCCPLFIKSEVVYELLCMVAVEAVINFSTSFYVHIFLIIIEQVWISLDQQLILLNIEISNLTFNKLRSIYYF